jgi:MIP family channel proteins
MNQSTKAGLAELIGTFMLVFLGAGAGALAGMNGAGIIGVALAHGMGLVVIIYTWGWVSGAHVNPAVTLAAWITGKVQFGTVITYWVAQILGGVLAAAVLSYLVGTGTGLGQTTGVLTPTAKNVEAYTAAKTELDKADTAEAKAKLASLMEPSAVKVIVVEAILTFFLVCSVFSNGIAGKNGNVVGLAIAFTLIADILCGGYLTGASMNPARTFGPAAVAGDLSYMWMYIVGPVVGAIIAGLLYNNVILPEESHKKKSH